MLGPFLQALREAAGLTLQQIADAPGIGVTRYGVHKWESDAVSISATDLDLYLRAVGLDPDSADPEVAASAVATRNEALRLAGQRRRTPTPDDPEAAPAPA